MARTVEISRHALGALVVALVLCLVALAFMLGRSSAGPQAVASPSPPPLLALHPASVEVETPLPAQRIPGSPTRAARPVAAAPPSAGRRAATGRPPVRRETHRPAAAPAPAPSNAADVVPPPAAPVRPAEVAPQAQAEETRDYPRAGASSARSVAGAAFPASARVSAAESDAVRRYLARVDAAVAGTGNLGDANAFATQLLQQSMQGDTRAFDQLIGSSEAALRELKAIDAPARCREHHSLMVGQLNSGIALLRRVKGATVSMDTTALASLSLAGKDMQNDVMRLQQLDRELRSL